MDVARTDTRIIFVVLFEIHNYHTQPSDATGTHVLALAGYSYTLCHELED